MHPDSIGQAGDLGGNASRLDETVGRVSASDGLPPELTAVAARLRAGLPGEAEAWQRCESLQLDAQLQKHRFGTRRTSLVARAIRARWLWAPGMAAAFALGFVSRGWLVEPASPASHNSPQSAARPPMQPPLSSDGSQIFLSATHEIPASTSLTQALLVLAR